MEKDMQSNEKRKGTKRLRLKFPKADMSKDKPQKKWESISGAAKYFGRPAKAIMSLIHEGRMPYALDGVNYKVNLEVAEEVLRKEDYNRMMDVRAEVDLMPLHNHNVAKKHRTKTISKVRQVVV